MPQLFRFGVSLEKSLLEKFDRLLKKRKYTNRSEAFRDLIRQELVKEEWHQDKEIAGAITLIYDHHKRDLVNKVTDIQHHFRDVIISTQHIHLDHNNCLEILALRGKPRDAQQLVHTLRSTKGVKHADLSMSTTGKDLD